METTELNLMKFEVPNNFWTPDLGFGLAAAVLCGDANNIRFSSEPPPHSSAIWHSFLPMFVDVALVSCFSQPDSYFLMDVHILMRLADKT